MNGEDIRKLLGGYATGTLSPDEQQALFEAALHDEKLFAALADEHALREMLDDPANRAAVLQALEPKASGWAWGWIVPAGALAGLVVIASIVFVFNHPAEQASFQMAKVVQPALQPEIAKEADAAPMAGTAPLSPTSPITSRTPSSSTPVGAATVRERPSAERRQLTDGAAPAPAVREVREEAKAMNAPAAPRSGASDSVMISAEPAILTAGSGAPSQGVPGKLQYTILKRGADGQFKPIDPSALLQPADAVRLNVEADEAGFLSISQKAPSKLLFQGAIQKQVPVTIPLDLNIQSALQIMFTQPNVAGSLQNALLPGASLSKSKVVTQKKSEQDASKDQGQTQGAITLDVNLNMAAPSQQRK